VLFLRSANSSDCNCHKGLVFCALLLVLVLPLTLAAQNPSPASTGNQTIAAQVDALKMRPLPLRPPTPLPPEEAQTQVSSGMNAQSGSTVAESAPVPAMVATAPTIPAKSVVASASAPTEPLKPKYDVRLIGRRDIGSGLNFYSLDREIALGRDLSKQVDATSKLVTDPVVTEYINRIGQNLVRNSDARVPFTIKVIDNEEVNAFALPGGFFYVDTGLILAADDEAELAAVMAHEIAHVAARHATKNMTKSDIWNLASIPLMFIGGPAGYAIAEVASLAVPMTFLKFSRDAEREADLLGLEYDYAAGYDPQAFVQFFEKLNADEKKKHSRLAKMFSTHPMNGDRVTAAQNEIREYLPDRDAYIVDTSEFEQVKARLMSLDNSLHLSTGDSHRPVLLKRTETSDTGSDTSGSSSTKSQDDPNRPTLKRSPQS
jgi:predicted Zn-dependent protease